MGGALGSSFSTFHSTERPGGSLMSAKCTTGCCGILYEVATKLRLEGKEVEGRGGYESLCFGWKKRERERQWVRPFLTVMNYCELVWVYYLLWVCVTLARRGTFHLRPLGRRLPELLCIFVFHLDFWLLLYEPDMALNVLVRKRTKHWDRVVTCLVSSRRATCNVGYRLFHIWNNNLIRRSIRSKNWRRWLSAVT